MKDQNEKAAGLFSSSTFISPLLAAGCGAAFGVGGIAYYANSNTPISLYCRSGVSGGLFFLGLYSGMRAFYQDDEFSTSLCVTGFGTAIGSGLKAVDFCKKRKKFLKPHPWPAVARSGLAGGLISLGLYGGVRTLFLVSDKYGAHRRN